MKNKITKFLRKRSMYLVIALLVGCSSNSEEVDLVLRYDPGDEFTIVSKTETSGSVFSLASTTEVDLKVISDSNGVYRINADGLKMKSATKMGGMTETYDSEKSENEMTGDEKAMHNEFRNLLNSEFNIMINNKGEILRSFEHTDGRALSAPLIDMDNILIVFPDKKVSVGDKWEHEKVNPITTGPTITTYKVKDITEDKVIIGVTSQISEVKGLLNPNTAKGEYVLEKKTGRLLNGKLEMDLQTKGKVTKTYTVK